MDDDTATQATTTTTVRPTRGPRFRMRRSPSDVMLAGVCAGIAEELDLDPALVRISVAVLTVLTSGVAALVYLAAWILAPVEPATA